MTALLWLLIAAPGRASRETPPAPEPPDPVGAAARPAFAAWDTPYHRAEIGPDYRGQLHPAFRPGDRVVSANGVAVTSCHEVTEWFRANLPHYRPGAVVTLVVRRGGVPVPVRLTLAAEE